MNNHKVKNKKKPQTHRSRYAWLLIGWLALMFIWFKIMINTIPPIYRHNYADIVNYPNLLHTHSTPNAFMNIGLLLIVGILVSLILAPKMGIAWRVLLMFPFCICGSIGWFVSAIDNHTLLTNLDTIQFDGHVYHLTLEEYTEWDIGSYTALLLHQCDQTGSNCRGRRFWRGDYGGDSFAYEENVRNTELSIARDTNQLVAILGDHRLLTLDAEIVHRTVPQNSDIISLTNVDDVNHLMDLHYDYTYGLDWSPDGFTLVSAGRDALWLHRFTDHSTTTNEIIAEGNNVNFSSLVVFSSIQDVFAFQNSYNSSIQLWDVDPLVMQTTLPIRTQALAFSPDGRLVAAHNQVDEIILLDTLEFSEVATLATEQPLYRIRTMVFSPDSQLLAASGYNYTEGDGYNFVGVWDILSGDEIFFQRQDAHSAIGIAFAPDSARLAFTTMVDLNPDIWSDYAYWLNVWDVQQETELLSISLENSPHTDLVWSHEGDILISADYYGHFHIWNSTTGDLVWSESLDSSSINAMALNAAGTILATANADKISLWSVRPE